MTTLEKSDEQFLSNLRGEKCEEKYEEKFHTEEELMNLSMEEIRNINAARVQHYIKDRFFEKKLATIANFFGTKDNSGYNHMIFTQDSIVYYYDFYGHFGRITISNNIVFQTTGPQIIKPGEWCDRLEELYTKAHSLKEIQDAERLNKEKEKFIKEYMV